MIKKEKTESMKQKKRSGWLFVFAFVVILGVMFLNTALKEKAISLLVPDNAGVTILETVEDSLVCVFQDGQVVVWDWNTLPQQQGDFRAVSDRAIVLDAKRLAAVTKTGKKVLTVYNLPKGQKQKDISVGWADQELWLRISPDKKTVAVVRRNNPDSQGRVLIEFLTVDIEKEILSSPATLSIASETEDVVDTAVDNNGVLYAAGFQKDAGRIAAIDLKKGVILWESVFEESKEFSSIAVSPDGNFVHAGNRDGYLYKINAESGGLIKKIQLLEEGETRAVTNDVSVLNTAFSGDGRYFVATITPRAYLLRTDTDTVIHRCSPTSNLTSKIAFSPDNQFFATSDIRASKPIKVWEKPEGK